MFTYSFKLLANDMLLTSQLPIQMNILKEFLSLQDLFRVIVSSIFDIVMFVRA